MMVPYQKHEDDDEMPTVHLEHDHHDEDHYHYHSVTLQI